MVQREELRAGLHRAKGVLNWRGVPENHPVRDRMRHFCAVIAELDGCFDAASNDQIDALHEAHDRLSRAMPELLRKQSEDALIVHEAEMLKALLDAANRHLQVWANLRARIEHTYVGLMAGASAGRSSGVDTRRKRARVKADHS